MQKEAELIEQFGYINNEKISQGSICVEADGIFVAMQSPKRRKEVIDELKSILASEQKVLEIIKKEMLEIKNKYTDDRRTTIDMTAIEYIRNAMKRVRKKDSSIILASQNIEDFLIPSIREFTKPLFSIPTHQFLFNAGSINPKEYMDALQVEQNEFELIKYPERGTCLYRCGNERYLLQVIAPDHKSKLFVQTLKRLSSTACSNRNMPGASSSVPRQ